MIRLAIADDHDLVLDGLRAALRSFADLELVGTAHDGLEAMRLLRDLRPDVAVLDLHMPRRSGLDVARAAQAEGWSVRLLIVASFDDEETYRAALAAGVHGYLGKAAGIGRLVEAIRALADGRTYLASTFGERPPQPVRAPVALGRNNPLTPREREILRLMATGLSNREIGDQLGATEGTVKNHVSNILRKLDVRDRTRAVLVALRDGWI